jgi:hypothetical protein
MLCHALVKKPKKLFPKNLSSLFALLIECIAASLQLFERRAQTSAAHAISLLAEAQSETAVSVPVATV